MKSNDQNRNEATALSLVGAKRVWNTPMVIEADLESTNKTPGANESVYPGFSYGPS